MSGGKADKRQEPKLVKGAEKKDKIKGKVLPRHALPGGNLAVSEPFFFDKEPKRSFGNNVVPPRSSLMTNSSSSPRMAQYFDGGLVCPDRCTDARYQKTLQEFYYLAHGSVLIHSESISSCRLLQIEPKQKRKMILLP
jgi:hypothetical protein